MWPDLWITLAALVAAVAAVPAGRWLARHVHRLWETAGQQAPARPTPPVTPGPSAESAAPPPLPPALLPAAGQGRRRLTPRAARDGVVLATILGACRAWGDDDGPA